MYLCLYVPAVYTSACVQYMHACEFHYSNLLLPRQPPLPSGCHCDWLYASIHHWCVRARVCVRVNQLKLFSLQPGQSQEDNVISISCSHLCDSRQMTASMHRTVNYDTRLFYFRPFHLIKYWTKPTGHKHLLFQEEKQGIHGSDSTHNTRASRSSWSHAIRSQGSNNSAVVPLAAESSQTTYDNNFQCI